MPSTQLTDTLEGLGDVGATLSKGTVAAVSTGLLTVTRNGSSFTRVPYLATGWAPTVGDQVYLLNQENFGMLVLGPAASTTPPLAPPAPTVVRVDPSTVGNWRTPPASDKTQAAQFIADRITSGQLIFEDLSWRGNPLVVRQYNHELADAFYAGPGRGTSFPGNALQIRDWLLTYAAGQAGSWVDLTGRLLETPPFVDTGVWFYPAASLTGITFDVASLTMELQKTSGGPLELVLHTSTGPSGSLTLAANTDIFTVNPPVSTVTQVPIPLSWAYALKAGTAKGIAMRSRTNTAEVFAHGSLTFTSL